MRTLLLQEWIVSASTLLGIIGGIDLECGRDGRFDVGCAIIPVCGFADRRPDSRPNDCGSASIRREPGGVPDSSSESHGEPGFNVSRSSRRFATEDVCR